MEEHFSATMIDTKVIQKRIKTSDHEETEEITITNGNYLIKSKKQAKTYTILSYTIQYYTILSYTFLYYPINQRNLLHKDYC